MNEKISIKRRIGMCLPYCLGIIALGLVQSTTSWSEDIEIQPYGYVEMDAVYSNRNTNPLDPDQFNGYVTAAGSNKNDSSTFNPRFSVIGLKATQTVGEHSLKAKVEMDFYGNGIGNPEPRLRLAFIDWAMDMTRLTVGQDWTPVASLNPSSLDFSVMGYGGNLWQRIPQITVRHQLMEGLEGLFTIMRFARGQTISYTTGGDGTGGGFNDQVKIPFFGSRIAYSGWGAGEKGLVALSGAWRQFKSTPTANRPENNIHSGFVSAELVVPVTEQLKFAGEISYGQAIGDEFFRFGQALNGASPVHMLAGFGEVKFVPNSDWSLATGYGFDDPNNSDLLGVSNTSNYLLNQRAYFNVTRKIVENFRVGAEITHIVTEWSNAQTFSGNQYMVSFWYGFWL